MSIVKGISTIIAIIIILMIVVFLAALAYLWFTEIYTGLTETGEKQISILSKQLGSTIKIESISNNKIYLRNTGNYDVNKFSVYIDDLYTNVNAPDVIKAKVLGTIVILDEIEEGRHKVKITANYAETEGWFTFKTERIEDSVPIWSNDIVNPASGVEYAPNANYQFNITWQDDNGVGEVIFEFDGTNYSYLEGQVSKDGNVYSKTLTDLVANPSGYSYRWYANDTINQWEKTTLLNYKVNKNTSARLFLYLNGTQGNKSYNKGDVANFTAWLNVSGKTIYLTSNYTGWGPPKSSSTSRIENYTILNTVGNWWNLIAYWNGDENYSSVNNVTYFFNVTTQSLAWYIETVDSSDRAGQYNSIALDPNNYPHISYHKDDIQLRRMVKYAYKDALGWHIRSIDDGESVGWFSSIALDSNNNPHISYLANGNLKYYSGWTNMKEIVDYSVGWSETSIVLESSNYPYPHISYQANGNLKYVHKDASGWHIETVDSNESVGVAASLALDSNNYPHISYHDNKNYDLKYAYKDMSGWHIEKLYDYGRSTSIALDSNNYPHISYQFSTMVESILLYTYKDSSGWHTEVADSQRGVGFYTSIALDSNNYPHISYWDYTNRDLKYAYKDSSGWHVKVVDSEGMVGRFSSLALDSNDNPHISYYDSTNYDLKYAYYG